MDLIRPISSMYSNMPSKLKFQTGKNICSTWIDKRILSSMHKDYLKTIKEKDKQPSRNMVRGLEKTM